MPDHKTHHKLSQALLGKAYPDVDRWIDEPYKYLGSRHRVLRHDALTPAVVFMRELAKSGDAEKALKKSLAALIHISADKLL